MKIPESFRGFAGEPRSEMEVVFLFGLLYDYLEFPFVVTAINDTFPDCEGLDPLTGKTVHIEFELLSRHYIDHGHPIEGSDYIVCWKNNWPDSPIPVISLQSLVKSQSLEGKRFIDIPAPDSLRIELENLKDRNPQAYSAVKHFLGVSLVRLQERFPDFYIDDTQTRHYGTKYRGRGGLVGVYPNGKLVCGNVDEIVKAYGESVRNAAMGMRDIIKKKIGILCNPEDGDRVAESLENLLLAIISNANK